ncbi:MAG: deoxyhypusine synthase [Archaeoglobaceae archaeon]
MRVVSPEIKKGMKVAELIDQFAFTAFNARRLAEAAKICAEMVRSGATIFLTLAGAMIPAGMRNVVKGFVENFASVVVTTGANVVHEIAEALGYSHEMTSPYVNDEELAETSSNRIYDVLIDTAAFEAVENLIARIVSEAKGREGSYEFLWRVGSKLEDSFLRVAADKKLPVVSPTLHDSVIGLHLSVYARDYCIDYTKDIKLLVDMCFESEKSGVIIVGGGVPKNFALQSMLLAEGFDYAVQITTDSPQFGGLSGATLEEAKSWCKLKKGAKAVTVYCDATIALPLIYLYLLEVV